MRSRSLLALLGLVLLAALWLAARRDGAVRTAAEPNAGLAPVAAAEPAELAREFVEVPHEARELVAAAPPSALVPALAAPIAVLPVERPRAALNVLVVDGDGRDAAPVEGAIVRAFASPGTTHDLLAFDDGRGDGRGAVRYATTGADGRARFADLALGAWWLVVERSGLGARARVHHADDREQRVVLDAEGVPARIAVHVVGIDGVGIEGALVEISGGAVAGTILKGDRPSERAGERWGSTLELSARTGPGGTAIFGDPGFAGFVVVARTDDGRGATAVAWTTQAVGKARRNGIELVVDRPGSLAGAVRFADGSPEALDGARVLARLLNNANPHYTTYGAAPIEVAVADGRYRFPELPAGRYTLALSGPGDARLALPRLAFGADPMENSLDPLEVEIPAGVEAVQDLDVERGGAIEGRVRAPDDEGGAPLAGAIVRATFAPRTSNFPDGFSLRGANVWRFDSEGTGVAEHPDTHPLTTTDALGRYRLGGLPAGRHRLEVAYGGRRYDVRAAVEVRSGETVRLEHVLERAGAIEGVRRYGSYLGAARPGDEAMRMVAILPRDGLFAFGGLEPGAWVLSSVHSDTSIAPVPLVTVTVEAGRTTWVDVDAEADATLPVRLTGRVIDGAGPIAGARVQHYPAWKTTDAQGRFDFGAAFTSTMWVTLKVAHGDVLYDFQFAGMERGSTAWNADLVLGDERLGLVTRDALGAPAAAEITLSGSTAERPGLRSVSVTVTTTPTGELVVEHLVPGDYGVNATFADGSTVWREFTMPRADALVLQAPPSGEIEVVVRTADGKPAPDRGVVASTWLGEGPIPDDDEARIAQSLHAFGRTGPDGRVLLRGVAAGAVRVATYVEWGSLNPAPPPEPQIVELGPGGRAEVVFDELSP